MFNPAALAVYAPLPGTLAIKAGRDSKIFPCFED